MAGGQTSYDVDQVRERTDLLALIGSRVALKKRGERYQGLCPFHQEKTPSFSVNPSKGFWHCFGCGKGGDAFTFLMQLERLTFPEALERLAERAGIQPKEMLASPKRKEERDFLFEVNAAAAVAFRKALLGSAGANARAYLAKRGIDAAAAERFGLGYSPGGWDALSTHLRGRGFAMEMLVKADLVRARTSGDGHFDFFRNRLMVPIHDRQGRVIAFGGRALAPDDKPKYLNTGETPIFHKGHTLYALHLASETIKKRDRAIVTEGYFDAIACHLAGFTEAVATLGTALSEDHARDLRRLAEHIYLVFDADSAGVNAALRGQSIFRQAGADVRIVLLPAGHDPDTLLREQGADAFERLLADALSPVSFELERLIAQHPEKDTESRVRLFRAAAVILQALPRLERAEYALWLIERWLGGARGDIPALQQAILGEVAALDRRPRPTQFAGQPPPQSDAPPEPVAPVAEERPIERELLSIMVQDASFAAEAVSLLPTSLFRHPVYRAIFEEFVRQTDNGQSPDARRIFSDDDRVTATIAALALREMIYTQPYDGLLETLLERYELESLKYPQQFAGEEEAREWQERLHEIMSQVDRKQEAQDGGHKRYAYHEPYPADIARWKKK